MNKYNREMFIGAKVTLDPKSVYWRYDTYSNPRGIVGKVVEAVAGSSFFVQWSNGGGDWYHQGDLKVLGEIVDG